MCKVVMAALNSSITVLLTGAGAPGAPGVIRSLRHVRDRKIHIVGADMNPAAAARSMVDNFHVIPPAREQDFIEAVKTVCRVYRVDVVLPLVTAELAKFAAHAAEFRQTGTVVSVSGSDSLYETLHKGRLFSTLQAAGITVPHHRVARTGADLLRALGELGYPRQTVCFKPVIGDGGRGFRVIDPSINQLRSLFEEKPDSPHVSYDEVARLLEGVNDIPETLAMEYLPGAEYSVDLLADRGRVWIAIPRLREKTVGGITTRGSTREDTDVVQYAARTVGQLGLHGNVGVQVRRNRAGEVRIIEVNPRIQGTIVHCTAAGVNLPYLAVKLALGIEPVPEELYIRWNVHMQRRWEEVYRDGDGTEYSLGDR